MANLDPSADLAAAAAALQATLALTHGTTKVSRAVTHDDKPYIGFAAAGRMVLMVTPYEHGWTALWGTGDRGDAFGGHVAGCEGTEGLIPALRTLTVPSRVSP